jgi:hypothetical protein
MTSHAPALELVLALRRSNLTVTERIQALSQALESEIMVALSDITYPEHASQIRLALDRVLTLSGACQTQEAKPLTGITRPPAIEDIGGWLS